MLVILSPAKKLDFETAAPTDEFTQLMDLDKSDILIKELIKCGPAKVSSMMKLSDSLTKLNFQRYKDFKRPFNNKNAKQAMFAFKGDTYVGLDADSMKKADIKYAQKHLRILSGLYGLVSPLDLILPYRLEMGTKLPVAGSKNLYQFWSETITSHVNGLLKKEKTLINLASKEYSTAIDFKNINGTIITPVFKDKKNGDFKIVSFFAKRARGMMSRYVIDNRIKGPEGILGFDSDGYEYNKKLSSEFEPVFTRCSTSR